MTDSPSHDLQNNCNVKVTFIEIEDDDAESRIFHTQSAESCEYWQLEDTDPIPSWGMIVTAEHWPETSQFHRLATPPEASTQGAAPANEVEQDDDDVDPIPPFGQIKTAEHWPVYQPRPLPSPNPPDPVSCRSEDEPPQPVEQPNLTRIDTLAGNCIRVAWEVPVKKFQSTDKRYVTPEFDLEGWLFQIVLKPCPDNVKGGFRGSNGVGKVELKFCGGMELGDTANVRFRVSAGKKKELSSGRCEHDFAGQNLSILPQEWDFMSVQSRGSVVVQIEARKEP